MNLTSKKTSLLLLAITALILSRAMFFFFKDPEGPNLLVVAVMAAIIYAPSLLAYKLNLSQVKKLLVAFLFQILVTIVVYFCL